MICKPCTEGKHCDDKTRTHCFCQHRPIKEGQIVRK